MAAPGEGRWVAAFVEVLQRGHACTVQGLQHAAERPAILAGGALGQVDLPLRARTTDLDGTAVVRAGQLS